MVFNMGAQQLKPSDILSSFEKIESVVQLSGNQKEEIKKAISLRQDSIIKIEDSSLKTAINNYYTSRFYQILTEEQSKKIIEAQIDNQEIEGQVDVFFNDKIESKGFPKYYEKYLREGLKQYQYTISSVGIKYRYDRALKVEARKAIYKKRSIWFSEHYKAIKKVENLWTIANKKGITIQASIKENFINYHLYVYFKNNQDTSNLKLLKELELLNENKTIKSLVASVVNCNSSYQISRFQSRLKDSILYHYVKKELDSAFVDIIETKVKLVENLIDSQSTVSPINIPEFIKTKQEEIKQVKSINALNVLAEKAKKAGLEEARVNKFIALVNKKEEDIAAYKSSINDNSTSNILEVGTKKNIAEIKRDFLKDLTSLISKKEFAEILGDDLKPVAIKKAKEEMKAVLASYKLTEEQRKAVYKKMAVYYLNETITNAYYKYDNRLLKQKLSGLRYYFEKEYKAMMDDFDIKMSPSKKAKKNTYQY